MTHEALRMFYFDKLPKSIRVALANYPSNVVNTDKVYQWYLQYGEQFVLDRIEANRNNPR